MIFDFPKLKHKTIDIDANTRKSVITRRPWVRIIWSKDNKVIVFRKWRVRFYKDDVQIELTQQDRIEAKT